MDATVQFMEKLLQTPGAQLLAFGVIILVIVFAVVVIGGLVFSWKFLPMVLEARKAGVTGDSPIVNTLLDQHGRTVSLLETKIEADVRRDGADREMLNALKAIADSLELYSEQTRIGIESVRNVAIDHHNTMIGHIDTVQAEVLRIVQERIDAAEKNLLTAIEAGVKNGTPIIIGVFTVNQQGRVVWANSYAQRMFEGIVGSNVHEDQCEIYDVNGNILPHELHPVSMALYRCQSPAPTLIGVKYMHAQELSWVLLNIEIVFEGGRCTGAVVTTALLSSVLAAMGVALKLS